VTIPPRLSVQAATARIGQVLEYVASCRTFTPKALPTYIMDPTASPGIVVISGGSAANNLVSVFRDLVGDGTCLLSYVIPISDNGGSSSELIRVFGGPGIGDVRSMRLFLGFS
jgi:hypothetical protein